MPRILREALHADLAAARRLLTSLDGAFAAFLWDEAAQILLVVNDFAGLQPLYVRRRPGEVAFAPRIDALADAADADPAGWGAFVGFGGFVGDRTTVQGVTRVPPATVALYHVPSDALTTSQYWTWPDVSPDRRLDRVDTGELLSILDANLRAYDVYRQPTTLLLSGGYETRLLAALLTRAGRPISVLSLRNPYEHLEIDGRFAARVAATLGLRHVIRDPSPDFFSSAAYLEYVRDQEVATTSVNLFIAQMPSELRAAGLDASWDGFAYGAVVKNKVSASFEALLGGMTRPFDGPSWQAARMVFRRDVADGMREGFERAIRSEIAACHPAPHGTQQFFHRNRTRHRIAPNTLKVYSTFLLPFAPGLAKAFYERVIPIPRLAGEGEVIYRHLFARHFPALARIPWCSGGHLMPGTRPGLTYRALAARSALIEHPRAGNALRRFGLIPSLREPACVADAVRSASADDPWLNADGVRLLQRTPPTGTNANTFARELLFYWSMWRQAMAAGSGASALSVA